MGTKFHINPTTGRPNICKAEKQPCKYAQGDFIPEHYPTEAAAREAYESKMADQATETVRKITSRGEKIQAPTFDDTLEQTIKPEVIAIQDLALGPSQNKIMDHISTAIYGREKKSMFGGRYAPSPYDAMNHLRKAATLAGKTNPVAKERLLALITTIENTKEVQSNSLYQSQKKLNETRAPKGARKLKENYSNNKFIELPNGNEVHAHVTYELSKKNNGETHFALKTPMGEVLKTSSKIEDLLK